MKETQRQEDQIQEDQSPRVVLKSTPLSPREIEDALYTPKYGALLTFSGRVRDHNEGKGVIRLVYEAYEPMALKEMEKILSEADQRFTESYSQIHHRLGSLELGDIAVVVVVASAHRKVTFEACQWIIDQLKARVPIFKHEHREEGEVWVGLGP